jgi:hypothetical protein
MTGAAAALIGASNALLLGSVLCAMSILGFAGRFRSSGRIGHSEEQIRFRVSGFSLRGPRILKPETGHLKPILFLLQQHDVFHLCGLRKHVKRL